MNLKLLMAGAIVAIILICAAAVAATSQQSLENNETRQAVPAASDGDGLQDGQSSTATAASIQAQSAGLPVRTVSGQVIECYGSGLAGLTVTLHLMGYNYTGDEITGTWEVRQLTTTTMDGPDAGRFVFKDVAIDPGVSLGYVSSQTTFSGGVTINGYSCNFTLEDDVNSGYIVLVDPDVVLSGI